MSFQGQHKTLATAAAAPPSLMTQVGMAGGAAVITVSFIHPIDVVKTRIQISTEYGKLGMGGTVSKIAGEEGVLALWKGINAAWLREASYTSLRLGLYEPVKVLFGANEASAPFYKKFLAGSAAGAIGSIAGNPFDVLKTKMMAAAGKEPPSMMATAKELLAKQGVSGFYRGIDSNILRAMVLNGTKMACYDQAKIYVVETTGWSKKALQTQFFSAVAAGFFMTCTVSPFDMVRTRLMNQPADARIYNNAFDCAVKIATQEGPLTFWRGFMPIWSRFAPTTTLQLVIFEQLRTVMGMQSL